MIAEVCDADLFEIKAVNEYSDIYKECVEQAKTEYSTNARPELKEDMEKLIPTAVQKQGLAIKGSRLTKRCTRL